MTQDTRIPPPSNTVPPHAYTPCLLQTLRKLIIERNYNVYELSKRTGYSEHSIYAFLSGRSSNGKVFSALCQTLSISLYLVYAPPSLPRKKVGRPRKNK